VVLFNWLPLPEFLQVRPVSESNFTTLAAEHFTDWIVESLPVLQPIASKH